MLRNFLHLIACVLFAACLAAAQAPSILDGGVINGASFSKDEPVSAGSLVSIFGNQLASSMAAADSIPLSTSLAGVSVTFNGVAAPLLFTSGGQVNVQVPWEVASSTNTAVNVVVTRDGVASAPKPVMVGPFSPGVFAANGHAIAINLDGTLAAPAGSIPGLTTHPAKSGDVILIYANGLGAVDHAVQTGHSSTDQLRNTLVVPVVLIGGMSAQVQFSGLTPQFVGVNQLNVVVPNAAPGDAVPVQLQLGGMTTTDATTMAISR